MSWPRSNLATVKPGHGYPGHGATNGASITSIIIPALDVTDRRPLHEQAASAIRGAVADGEVEPGDRLPPARDLASALGINANTALRALRQLRDEGVLEFRRGRGVSVLHLPPAGAELREKVRQLLDEAERCGYGPEDVVNWIREAQ